MIIFDKEKYVKKIVKEHITPNAIGVRFTLRLISKYYLTYSKYKPYQIKNILKKVSKDYFRGMPDKVINDEIEDIFASAKKSFNPNNESIESAINESDCENDEEVIELEERTEDDFTPKIVTIYKEELDRIIKLNNKNAENLAFIFLVVYKFFGYDWMYENNSDIYRLAELNASGNTKNELLYLLSKNKMIRFNTFVNKDYKNSKQNKIAETKCKVLFCTDDTNNVAFTISDYDDLILYYRDYVGDENIVRCVECGRPIRVTGNSKKYCNDCANMLKQESNKKSKAKIAG